MIVYSSEQLEQMYDSFHDCVEKLIKLMLAYVMRGYITERGREFGVHGLARRIKTIEYGLRDVFEIIPPESKQPSMRELSRANSITHSILVNVFGSLDNIAHLWVHENHVRDADGNLLVKTEVGLAKHHKKVLSSLPSELRSYVETLEDWHRYLSDYRHALAHRIPPYLVPRTLTDADRELWRSMEKDKLEAIEGYDFERHDAISQEQDLLGTYNPLMMHSFIEGARPVRFHGQIICDALTVHELGERFLEHLPTASSKVY